MAKRHAWFDGLSGAAASVIPIVGAPAALAVQLTAQVKVLYPDLIHRLAFIYGAEPDEVLKRRANLMAIAESFGQFAINELIVQGVETLGAQLGTEFIQEIGSELAVEAGPGVAAGMIPVVGIVLGAADAILAATMTWRVGTMISLYFQNGDFVGTRKNTYDFVKRELVPYSHKWNRPGTLDRIRHANSSVRESMIRRVRERAKLILLANPDKDLARRILIGTGHPDEPGFPPDIVDAALVGL